jgi:hypothetical protein
MIEAPEGSARLLGLGKPYDWANRADVHPNATARRNGNIPRKLADERLEKAKDRMVDTPSKSKPARTLTLGLSRGE